MTSQPRTIVVTGSASGIGLATAELLSKYGHTVIHVDLSASDIQVDLSTPDGRDDLARAVASRSGGVIDGVVACAGIPGVGPATVAVNYFGTLATLDGLHPLLVRSEAPRAVVVSSTAALREVDDELLAAMATQNEPQALARATELVAGDVSPRVIYASSKRSLSQWVRRMAPTPRWAGQGIALNAIAPGVVRTAMTAAIIDDPSDLERMSLRNPAPLNGFADPVVPARLLAWLVGVENTHLCGQVLYVDGGSESLARRDDMW